MNNVPDFPQQSVDYLLAEAFAQLASAGVAQPAANLDQDSRFRFLAEVVDGLPPYQGTDDWTVSLTKLLARIINLLPNEPVNDRSSGAFQLFRALFIYVSREYGPHTRALAESPAEPPAPVNEAALRLATYPQTVAIERHLAKVPAWAPSNRAPGHVQLSLLRPGWLYGLPFNILETDAGAMTDRDLLFLANLIKRLADAGLPEHRTLRLGWADGARDCGYEPGGAGTRRLVWQSLIRLAQTRFEQGLEDGQVIVWGPLDSAGKDPRAPRNARLAVKLHEVLVYQIHKGSLTYLSKPVLQELVNANGYAARLWVFLESEKLPANARSAWKYPLFSHRKGEFDRETPVPPIAKLLRIEHWESRRRVAQVVRKAAHDVMAADSTYTLSLDHHGRDGGMWYLSASQRTLRTGERRQITGTSRYANRDIRVQQPGHPGTQTGTSGYAHTLVSAANSGNSEGGQSVLQSSYQSSKGFDVSKKAVENLCARAGADPTGIDKELAKVAETLRQLAPMHFGAYAPEEIESEIWTLVRYAIQRIPQNAANPVGYLEGMRQNTATEGLAALVDDDGLRFVSGRLAIAYPSPDLTDVLNTGGEL